MPAAVIPFLRGRDVTVFSLTPLTVAANGTITAGSASSLVGSWDQITINSRAVLEDISSSDTLLENPMIVKDGTSVTVREIIKRSGGNILPTLLAAGDYFLLNLTRGDKAWALYLVREGLDEELAVGKSLNTATFRTFDPTVPNPAFGAAS